ncbi:putative PEP-binding protein [Micromonospora zamorensis]|uniref:putative PEP-binding protein n=1 Tax=Micromonospora zamorensis TaxID=709883 RepID=UPI0033CFBDFD
MAPSSAMSILAGISSSRSITAAVEAGAAGVGLVRTELLFPGATMEPGIEPQTATYMRIMRAFPSRPVIFRTWDPAPDKSLPFLASTALNVQPNDWSWRGIRCYSGRPGVLDRQLGCIRRAADECDADVSVIAPMVATLDEAQCFVARARILGLERAGIMIEVPAMALMLEEVLGIVDLVAIGLVDLAQYTFAANRESLEMRHYLEPWQPALVKLLKRIADACGKAAVPAGVCGIRRDEIGLLAVLQGLSFDSVTLPSPRIEEARRWLRSLTPERSKAAADAALSAETPLEARARVAAVLEAA